MAKRKAESGKGSGKRLLPADIVEPTNIDPKLIDPSPFQPRQDFPADDIEDLAESMARLGMLQPIAVRPKGNRFELLEGERRLRACKLLKLKAVRAEVQDRSDAEARAIVIESSMKRKELNAIEEAIAFRAMIDAGDAVGPTELAKQLGLSQGHVSNRLRLLGLPEPIKKRIISREIPPTHARYLLFLKDHPKILERVVKRVNTGGDLGSVAEFRDDIGVAVDEFTRPMLARRWDRHLHGATSIFKPTEEQRRQLGLISVEDYNGKSEERATNTKLWEKLQAAHLVKLKLKTKKDKPAGKTNQKPLTPAEQKAAAAEEKRKATERAEYFRCRLYKFKIDWLRYLIGHALLESEPNTILRFLTFLAIVPDNDWSRKHRLVGQLKKRDATIKKRGAGPRNWNPRNWNPLADLAALENSDAVEAVARVFAASCFWDADSPNPEIPPAEVETLADFLCIGLAAAWKAEQAGPLSKRYWDLHTKEQLVDLARELGCSAAVAATKSATVKALLAAKTSRMPREILKVKRPR